MGGKKEGLGQMDTDIGKGAETCMAVYGSMMNSKQSRPHRQQQVRKLLYLTANASKGEGHTRAALAFEMTSD